MKITTLIVLFLLILTSSHAQMPESYPPDFRDAMIYGAKAKMTLKIIDDGGKPVSNALVKVQFSPPKARKLVIDGGLSDSNGIVVAEGITTSTIPGDVSKDGYYNTWFKFRSGDPADPHDYAKKAKNGRWLPWNPTIPIVLKEIRAPVSMIHSRDDVNIPSFEESLGFDFEKGDWVAPNGKGIVPDMMVSFIPEEKEVPFHKLVVEFPGAMNGAYLQKKDNYSILKSIYRASLEVSYEQRIENANGERGPVHVLLGGDDYLVFRVRSVVDEKGALVAAHYGKIYGSLDYFVMARDKLRLVYYFNSVVNDTNLEFDGKGWGEFWGR